jgi:hypothetical protein
MGFDKNNGTNMRCKAFRILLVSSCSILWILPVLATEGGSQEWPVGVDTVDPALVPPVGGNMVLSYTAGYTASRLNGNDGKSSQPSFQINLNFLLSEMARH